jgi:1,4-dihydroxy-2-naphthoate octaprenyltransferase
VSARAVRAAALICFAVSAAVGLVLASETSWWLVALGAGALAAGWLYTGGPRPYGYLGLGELFVFAFFGLLATVGTSYAQLDGIPTRAWWLAVSCGGAACALLEANNLRDITGDRAAGKNTLAVRLGRRGAAGLVAGCVALVVVGAGVGGSWVSAIVAAVLFVPALVLALSPREGRDLLVLLVATARAQILLGVTLVVTCFLVH